MENSRLTAGELQQIHMKHQRVKRIKLNLWCWAFMSMTVLFYAAFQGYPILCSIYYSFLDWSGLTSKFTFVGLGNYQELLGDRMFWNAFQNSFRYTLMIVPLQLALSLFLAYLLNNSRLKGRTIYRSLFFVPVVTTSSIVGIVMIFIWSVQGPVNSLLLTLGINKAGINYLGNKAYAMSTVVLISAWKDCGTYMIYWLAGLQSVPRDLYEAA